MKIEHITIENIRSYDKEKIEFDEGLMLIHGDNGSGKSSLLSSIFGGLYLSNVLDYIDNDLTLDSIVRRTKDNGKISLTFSIGNNKYTVEWVISVSEDEDGERSASSTSCTLTGDTIDEPIEGVKAVNSTVQDIIGMGPESFVNSVYVQQGDITRMVDANDDERKEIIDGLLGLSKLDNYIERMNEARREIGAQVRKFGELIEEKERQLNENPDKSELKERLSELKSIKKELEKRKDKVESKISKNKEKQEKIKNKLNSYKEISEEYKNKKSELEKLEQKQEKRQTKQDNAESEKEAICIERDALQDSIEENCKELDINVSEDVVKKKLDTVRTKYNEVNTDVSSLKKGKLSTINNSMDQCKENITEYKQEKEDLISTKSSLKENIEKIKDEKEETENEISRLEQELENEKSTLYNICESIDLPTNTTPEELRDTHIPNGRENLLERSRKIYESLGSESVKFNQKIELNEEGVCPVCQTEHENTNHNLEFLKDKREEIQQKADAMKKQQELFDSANQHIDNISDIKLELAQVQSTLKQIEQRLEDKKSKVSNTKDEIQDIKEELEVQREKLENKESEKEDILEDIQEKQKKLDEYKMDVEKLENIVNMFSSLNDLENEIQSRESTIEHNKELKKEIRNQRLDQEKEVNELKEKLNDIDNKELEDEYENKKTKLDKFEGLDEKIDNNMNSVRDELAEVKQILKQIESLEKRYEELEMKKVDAAEKEVEAESVIDTYKNVKTQLRKENIGLLNKYANEVFKSVYHSKVYQRLEIDSDYSIDLITGDGVRIKPEELSGGEETIVSLAIRAGVYRLLVERNGTADKLPPFILDEPTTFLDTNHVTNLQNVIDTINNWDVPQILVVSHKDDLIQNADISYNVKKNPATETSSVDRTKL